MEAIVNQREGGRIHWHFNGLATREFSTSKCICSHTRDKSSTRRSAVDGGQQGLRGATGQRRPQTGPPSVLLAMFLSLWLCPVPARAVCQPQCCSMNPLRVSSLTNSASFEQTNLSWSSLFSRSLDLVQYDFLFTSEF